MLYEVFSMSMRSTFLWTTSGWLLTRILGNWMSQCIRTTRWWLKSRSNPFLFNREVVVSRGRKGSCLNWGSYFFDSLPFYNGVVEWVWVNPEISMSTNRPLFWRSRRIWRRTWEEWRQNVKPLVLMSSATSQLNLSIVCRDNRGIRPWRFHSRIRNK